MRFPAVLLFCLTILPPAFGDTIYLKTGEVLRTEVERYSDGAFWVKDGRRTYILKPEEILKIVFQPFAGPHETTGVAPRSRGARPGQGASGGGGVTGMVQTATAALRAIASESGAIDSADTTAREALAIVSYEALLNSGIFQIVGEVENRLRTPARYVKITVVLMDRSGSVVDQNFSYVHPDPPHLEVGQRKAFKVSFLHPPQGVTKYKIRVESSPF